MNPILKMKSLWKWRQDSSAEPVLRLQPSKVKTLLLQHYALHKFHEINGLVFMFENTRDQITSVRRSKRE